MDREAAELVQNAGGKVLEDGMLARNLCEQAKKNNVAIFELLHALKMDMYIRVRPCTAACHISNDLPRALTLFHLFLFPWKIFHEFFFCFGHLRSGIAHTTLDSA
jgi:hypothetical protein